MTRDRASRERTAEAASQSEERLHLATKSAGLAIFDHDVQSDLGVWLGECSAVIGLPDGSEATFSDLLRLVHPDDRDRVDAAAAASLDPAGSGLLDEEYRIVRPDTGEVRWILHRARIRFGPVAGGRTAVRSVGVFTDITTRRRRQQRQRFLFELGEELRQTEEPEVFIGHAIRTLGELLRVWRVVCTETDAGAGADRVLGSWATAGAATCPDELLRAIRFQGPRLEQLRRGETLRVDDLGSAPQTHADLAALAAIGARSCVCVPVLREGRNVFNLNVLLNRGRLLRDDEVQIVEAVAGLVWAAIERGQAEAAARERERRAAFRLQLSEALNGLADPQQTQELASGLLGEHLGVCRVAYGEVEPGGEFIVVTGEWRKPGAQSVVGRYRMDEFGTFFTNPLREGKTPAIEDAWTDPRVRRDTYAQTWGAIDTRAAIAHGLVKGGQMVAAIFVHSSLPRRWSEHDIALVAAVGERIWAAVQWARAEVALRASEDRYRTLFHTMEQGYAECELVRDEQGQAIDHRLLTLNPAFERMTGVRVSEVRGRLAGEVFPWLDRWWVEEFERIVRRGKPARIEHYAPALGRWFDVHVYPGPGDRFVEFYADITDRKRAELAMQDRALERAHTLRLLLETAAQGIISVDNAGRIELANAAIETMFGYGPGELLGRSVEDLLPQPLRQSHALHRAAYFATPSPRPMGRGVDLFGQRKDGSVFPVEISLNHVAAPAGPQAIAFVTDITERVTMLAQLRETKGALEERSTELERRALQLRRLATELTLAEQQAREHLSRTLHDGLQQLLFSAKIKVDQLAMGQISAVEQPPMLEEIRGDIDECIAASRSLAVELFPRALHDIGLPPALRWLAQWMHQRYGLTVDVSADPASNPADKNVRTLVFESIRELLFNAVKHAEVDHVHVDLRCEEEGVLLAEVIDEGVGFDPQAVGDRADLQQVGLGLFGIGERLSLLGGSLDITSAPGRGARFRIAVPFSRVENVPTSAEGPAAPRLRLLIVDDHAAMRAGLRSILRSHRGIEVVGEAANGKEALAKAHALHPDVVVMDVSMPEMDGVEATRRLRAELPSTVVLGLSTFERPEQGHAMEHAGAMGFFTKGEDMRRLVQKLEGIQAARVG